MKTDTPVSRIEGRLLEWFFTDESIAPLVVVRIGLGLVAVLSTLQYLPHVEWLWSEDGFLAMSLQSYQIHPLRFHTNLVFGTILVSSACLTVGLATRASGLLAALSMAVLGSSGHFHTWGWSTVMPALLGIVALSPGRNGWSVDAWWSARRGTVLPLVAPCWAMRLLQVHVAVVYLSASWHRYNDRGWIHGEMVYAAFANGMYTRFPYVDPQPFKPIFTVLTYATEALELAAPIALWLRQTRILFALALLGLHVGLEAVAIVGWWQPMMIVLLVVFLPPSWSRRGLDGLRGLVGRPGSIASKDAGAV
jgi:uncharacterized membrane protein YphA (DoxX/SURF4 family)